MYKDKYLKYKSKYLNMKGGMKKKYNFKINHRMVNPNKRDFSFLTINVDEEVSSIGKNLYENIIYKLNEEIAIDAQKNGQKMEDVVFYRKGAIKMMIGTLRKNLSDKTLTKKEIDTAHEEGGGLTIFLIKVPLEEIVGKFLQEIELVKEEKDDVKFRRSILASIERFKQMV